MIANNSTPSWPLNSTDSDSTASDLVLGSILPPFMETGTVVSRIVQGLLAIFLNSLTVAVIVKFEYLRTSEVIILFCLALTDIMGGLSSFLLFIYTSFELPFDVWYFICVFDRFLATLSSGLNVGFILLIALDRFIFINFPLRYYHYVNKRRTKMACLGMFLFMFFVTVMLRLVGLKIEPSTVRKCSIANILTSPGLRQLGALILFIVVTIVTIFMYARITCIARRQHQRIIEQVGYLDFSNYYGG